MAQKLPPHHFWEYKGPRPSLPDASEQPEQDLPLNPASRMEVARRLAQDPDYPSEEIIQTLADMLARHWYP